MVFQFGMTKNNLNRKWCFLLAVLCLFCSLEGKEVSQILQSIPSKDKERLEFFFSFLVQFDNLGFVLFGNTKPAAFCSIPLVCNYPVVPKSIPNPLQYQKDLKRSWAVWTRYRNRFKHPNIIVCEEYDGFKKSAFVQLIFIDKRKLTTLLAQFREDFAEVLGEDFSSEKFIAQIEKKRKLRPLIHHDEKLLGLILGFGKESASTFKNVENSGQEDPNFKIAGRKPKGCCIIPVSFKGNPDSDQVKTLIDIYTKEILEIEEIFKSDTFLLTALEKFCSP